MAKGLQDNDTWQDGYYADGKRREIDFWFGDHVPAGPAPGTEDHAELSEHPELGAKAISRVRKAKAIVAKATKRAAAKSKAGKARTRKSHTSMKGR